MLLAVDHCKSALLSASIKDQSSPFSMVRIDNGRDNGRELQSKTVLLSVVDRFRRRLSD